MPSEALLSLSGVRLAEHLQEVGIKVNSRKVLGAVLKNSGVPARDPARHLQLRFLGLNGLLELILHSESLPQYSHAAVHAQCVVPTAEGFWLRERTDT